MLTEALSKELERIRLVNPTIKHYESRDEYGTILCTAEFVHDKWVDTTEQRKKQQDLEREIANAKSALKRFTKEINDGRI